MVLANNTFSLRSIRFEAPLRSRKIQVRFDRRNFKRVIVYFKGECQGSGGRVDERPPGGPDSRRSAPRCAVRLTPRGDPDDPFRWGHVDGRLVKGWPQEAALRMLMNNLDPEVAERPEDLVVYGGTGKAARSWEAFDVIVRELEALGDDETFGRATGSRACRG